MKLKFLIQMDTSLFQIKFESNMLLFYVQCLKRRFRLQYELWLEMVESVFPIELHIFLLLLLFSILVHFVKCILFTDGIEVYCKTLEIMNFC